MLVGRTIGPAQYFYLLVIRVMKYRDIWGGLILLVGIGIWDMDQYLPMELCKLVSLGVPLVDGGSSIFGKILLISLDLIFPNISGIEFLLEFMSFW